VKKFAVVTINSLKIFISVWFSITRVFLPGSRRNSILIQKALVDQDSIQKDKAEFATTLFLW